MFITYNKFNTVMIQKMDATFINFENSQKVEPYRLLLNLSHYINLILYQILAFIILGTSVT